jgi:hypothetical protein
MFSAVTAKSNKASLEAAPLLRLVLYKGEIFHLPGACQEIRILSGSGWLTRAGRDIILRAGERASIPASTDSVLISGLGQSPLIFEVWVSEAAAPDELRLISPAAVEMKPGRFCGTN